MKHFSQSCIWYFWLMFQVYVMRPKVSLEINFFFQFSNLIPMRLWKECLLYCVIASVAAFLPLLLMLREYNKRWDLPIRLCALSWIKNNLFLNMQLCLHRQWTFSTRKCFSVIDRTIITCIITTFFLFKLCLSLVDVRINLDQKHRETIYLNIIFVDSLIVWNKVLVKDAFGRSTRSLHSRVIYWFLWLEQKTCT